jgi:septal ring factor EnvC (AmiA/AmiB activator)
MEWLLMMTQLPATPSSLRVNVWRRLKNKGAISNQNGAWLLPRIEENETFLKRLQLFITENGATSQLFILQSVDEATDEGIINKARMDREEEYKEVLEQCEAFYQELEEESENHILTFIELEDNEQKLHRLKHWIAKINKRDFMQDSPTYKKLVKKFNACSELLRQYTFQVYEKEGIKIENPKMDVDDDGLLTDYDFPIMD